MNSKQNTRTPRSVEKREQEVRNEKWTPPNLLPDPLPKDGWSFKWVRISTQAQEDPMNYSKKLREGWSPVPIEDCPEMEHLVLDPNPRFKGNVEVGGLLLCKNSVENTEARRDYQNDMTNRQMESVDNNYMRSSDPRMPVLKPERSTRKSFGK